MNSDDRVAVCSRSFSSNPVLRAEILEKYLKVSFNDAGERLVGDRLVEFLQGHDKAIIGLESIDRGLLDRVPELKVVSKYGVGLDMIDLKAMSERGIRLGWTPGVNSRSVAELVLVTAISLLRHIPALVAEVREGGWRQPIGHCLSGQTVGIIGWGAVGRDLTTLLAPFSCEILVNDILEIAGVSNGEPVEVSTIESLLGRADVVTLHVPLGPGTVGLLDEARLSLMKETAVLINTSRGGVVDETCLASMLREGRLAGAACDVFEREPPTGSELLGLANFLPTPHIGGSTHEAYLTMGRAAIAGLDDNQVPLADHV
jgi:phosphoglycerate dehydrogenase-like enzyme